MTQIDDVDGFENTLFNPFKERVEANGLSVHDLNMVIIKCLIIYNT